VHVPLSRRDSFCSPLHGSQQLRQVPPARFLGSRPSIGGGLGRTMGSCFGAGFRCPGRASRPRLLCSAAATRRSVCSVSRSFSTATGVVGGERRQVYVALRFASSFGADVLVRQVVRRSQRRDERLELGARRDQHQGRRCAPSR
jgi:hypothetical protein